MATKRPFTAPPGIKIPSTGTFILDNTTASTGTTVGALVISGGVGIGGSLYVNSATSISGIIINAGVITGSLTGSATTTNYSHQSGYAITSSSSGTANTSTYANQSGYAITSGTATTSGFATTASYSYQSGYGLTSGLATTSTYSHQSGYAITSGSSSFASTASYSYQSGYGLTSGLATTANYAHQSGYAITSGSSNTSGYATTSGLATTSTNINVVSATTNASHPVLFTPAAGTASGAAVSSETSFVYNPSTDILSVSGLAITSGTASTSSSSGALTVSGGAGIAQSVSIGGRLQIFNGANYTAFVSSASGNTVYTLPATSPATGSSVLQSTSAGVMSWVPLTATGAASGNTAQNVAVSAAGNANVFHPILFTPSSLSAGSAISSDTTIAFNSSTEILHVSGLAITSGTASTNTTTGALVVRGGLGVTGQLSFATASFGFTGITANPIMSFIGATSSSPITLTVQNDNSLNWEGSQGSVFSIDSNLSTGEIFSVSDISGLPIISASAGQTVNINEFGGYTQIGNGTLNSSSTTTGALVVSGGLGITGNANIGGTVRITNTTVSSSSSTGSLVVSGGVGISGTLNVGLDLGISGLTTLTYTSEKLNTKTSAGSAGTVTHDLSTGSIFYHSSISNNFTANFTNVPTTNDRAIGVTLILAQGVTPYMSTVLQLDGSTQTIKWVNNTTPTGTASKVDIVGFSLIRTGSAWTVLGQYSTYG